jgi:hypothetical protein
MQLRPTCDILAPMPLVGEGWGEEFIARHEAPLIR